MQEDHSEAKRAAEMARRQQEALEMQRAIDKSRAQQLAMRAAKKQQDKEQEEVFMAAWSQRLRELEEEDEAERLELWERRKHHQGLLLRQMEIKTNKKRAQKEQELEEAFISKLAMEEEDRMFEDYTTTCIDEWTRNGKDIRPMTIKLTHEKSKEAKGIMPAMTDSFR